MGFQPMPYLDTTLVYSRSTKTESLDYVDSIKKVLKAYQNTNLTNADCSNITAPRVTQEDACQFNYSALTAQCNEANDFGMAENKPCVLLKLNKIYGWIPEVWKKDEAASANLPESIKNSYSDDRIWIDCHGENPADVDNLGEPKDIQYFPQQGFPLAFYPYKKQKDYRSPLVFVKFNNVTRHVGIMIELQNVLDLLIMCHLLYALFLDVCFNITHLTTTKKNKVNGHCTL
ncbi:Sodium/potassium-transporting ATPase subunit beta-2 [Bulinus truncatus]|nr:Sodium/potassium-transporting ATPase subunit beta-2 [Bulinus truncatus]